MNVNIVSSLYIEPTEFLSVTNEDYIPFNYDVAKEDLSVVRVVDRNSHVLCDILDMYRSDYKQSVLLLVRRYVSSRQVVHQDIWIEFEYIGGLDGVDENRQYYNKDYGFWLNMTIKSKESVFYVNKTNSGALSFFTTEKDAKDSATSLLSNKFLMVAHQMSI
jgi:hypothetical protein